MGALNFYDDYAASTEIIFFGPAGVAHKPRGPIAIGITWDYRQEVPPGLTIIFMLEGISAGSRVSTLSHQIQITTFTIFPGTMITFLGGFPSVHF